MVGDVSAPEPLDAWERLGQRIGFQVSYAVGDSKHATITVEVENTFIDSQVVTVDDPLLPYTIKAQVMLGRLVQFELSCVDRFIRSAVAGASGAQQPAGPVDAYEEQILQKDLQRPYVSLVKNWAACGREAQDIVVDCAEKLGRRLTEEEITDLPGELRYEVDRLHASQEDALHKTLKALAGFQAGQRRRAREEGGATPLDQVVREYKDAVERGVRAPRALVAERLSYHPAHVGRLLSQAREQGLLPPAKPRGRPKKGQV
ncbi:hypothetical protein [Actinomadura sp. 3N508]|uniref:hypothetical protein n=1 Tax=Actinomadura sp. 3N508 TaxID=3375153 RepID=UPI0037A4588A